MDCGEIEIKIYLNYEFDFDFFPTEITIPLMQVLGMHSRKRFSIVKQ